MSGAKRGSSVSPEVIAALAIAPIALTFLAAKVGVKAGVALCRGAVRLSNEIYNTVYDKADQLAKEQVQRAQKEIRAVMENIHKPDDFKIPSFEKLANQAAIPNEESVVFLQKKLDLLRDEKSAREEYEKSKNLRNNISQKITREIQKCQEKLAWEIQNREKVLEDQKRKLAQLKQQEKNEMAELIAQINSVCANSISLFYPEMVREIKEKLAESSHNYDNLRQLVRTNPYRALVKKLKSLSEEKIADLSKLLRIKQEYDVIPIMNDRLSEDSKKRFQKLYFDLQIKAEAGNLSDDDVANLKEKLKLLKREAEQADQKHRFIETIMSVQQALDNRGYTSISQQTSSCGRYLVLTGKKPDGKKVTVHLLLPEISTRQPDVLSFSVDQAGYADKSEWIKEGSAFAREIESLGVLLNFREAMTFFNGKLLKSAVQNLQRQWSREQPGIQIELVEDNIISINGNNVKWPIEASVEDMYRLLKTPVQGKNGARRDENYERKRLRED
ncbi:hypothetical protein JW935_10100 [candidate division KSB1 bacterium]|nr:hypothetical protein [candidate division KSB1 bacterium]